MDFRRAGTGAAERRQAVAERLTRLFYRRILATRVAFGTGGELGGGVRGG
jgi:hypothetical protein